MARKPPIRQSTFTDAIGDRICVMLIDGRSLKSICTDDDMPAQSTVFKWLTDIPSFSEKYARARELQADTIADEILHIADNTEVGVEITTEADGTTKTKEGDMVAHRRLKIDSRKWYAGKLAPKKYGDRSTVDLNANVSLSLCDALKELPEK